MSTASLYVEPDMSIDRALDVVEQALNRDSHFSVYDIGTDKVEPMLPLRQAVVTLRAALNVSESERIELVCWRALFGSPEANAAEVGRLRAELEQKDRSWLAAINSHRESAERWTKRAAAKDAKLAAANALLAEMADNAEAYGDMLPLVGRARAHLAGQTAAPRIAWQCSACKWGFAGKWQKVCPQCGASDWWTGSVHPGAKLWTGQPAVWPCPRTYPLDPVTAEDPCEQCGRDEGKHEIGPRA